MTMTNAERQLRYRRRKLSADGDAVRVDMLVSVTAAARLQRLARNLGCSKRAALERALSEAEAALTAGLTGEEHAAWCSD